ncbi:MAG TPA: hypothetical protein VIT45_14600 [Allosphingosinicella sp.]
MHKSIRPIAFCAAALAAVPAIAALPPNYQRLAELRAVLDHPAVGREFGMDSPVERIEYVRPDLYRVSGGGCRMLVAIHGLPMPRDTAGPRRFEARPGRKECS